MQSAPRGPLARSQHFFRPKHIWGSETHTHAFVASASLRVIHQVDLSWSEPRRTVKSYLNEACYFQQHASSALNDSLKMTSNSCAQLQHPSNCDSPARSPTTDTIMIIGSPQLLRNARGKATWGLLGERWGFEQRFFGQKKLREHSDLHEKRLCNHLESRQYVYHHSKYYWDFLAKVLFSALMENACSNEALKPSTV